MTKEFSYAVQIQPVNGQELYEYPEGLSINARPWTAREHHAYPQAARQVGQGFVLVTDQDNLLVYIVPAEEI